VLASDNKILRERVQELEVMIAESMQKAEGETAAYAWMQKCARWPSSNLSLSHME
jgi:hypothetical protein